MKAINQLRKRKGVSPVIATVILVAVTITVAVAVAYWMSGIAGQYTKFEKVEVQSAYAQKWEDLTATPVVKGWKVFLELQNTGSGEATLASCFVNDAPLDQFIQGTDERVYWTYMDSPTTEAPMPAEGITILSGVKQIIYVYIESHTGAGAAPIVWTETIITFTSGTTLNVKLHSASGMDYIKLVQLT